MMRSSILLASILALAACNSSSTPSGSGGAAGTSSGGSAGTSSGGSAGTSSGGSAAASSGGSAGTSSGGSAGTSSGGSAGTSSGGAAGASSGSCPVVGVYSAKVTTSYGPATSVTTLNGDGTFSIEITLDANGAVTTLKGTYTVSGGQITFLNTSGTSSNGGTIGYCPGVQGVYSMTWSTDCSQVTLHKVSDSCPPREQEADGTTLTRK